MTAPTPKISVVMSVYNGVDDYIRLAMDSILSQTFTDFEFIVINDGSTNNCAEIIKKYQDPRICYVEHSNMGLDASLNKGIALARGKYIARMDPDDISTPQRFERQIHVLEQDISIGMVGAACYVTDAALNVRFVMAHPSEDAEIKWLLLFDSPFVHSTVMARRELLLSAELYKVNPELAYVGDYALWSRLGRMCNFRNLPEPLLHYREHPGGMSKEKQSEAEMQSLRISVDNLSHLVNENISMEDARRIRILYFSKLDSILMECTDWRYLHNLIYRVYLDFCLRAAAKYSIFSAENETAIRKSAVNMSLNLVKSLDAAGKFREAVRAMIQTIKIYPESSKDFTATITLSSVFRAIRQGL